MVRRNRAGHPQRWPRRDAEREYRGPQAASASRSIIETSVSTPAAKQNRSNEADTSSKALPTGVAAESIADVVVLFMALLSFRGISTPSLQAQGEQRRSSYFNIHRDIASRKYVQQCRVNLI